MRADFPLEDIEEVRVVDLTPEGWATSGFGIVADYGWAERILCERMYLDDAVDLAELLAEKAGARLTIPVVT
jgi:hypothetical protein